MTVLICSTLLLLQDIIFRFALFVYDAIFTTGMWNGRRFSRFVRKYTGKISYMLIICVILLDESGLLAQTDGRCDNVLC